MAIVSNGDTDASGDCHQADDNSRPFPNGAFRTQSSRSPNSNTAGHHRRDFCAASFDSGSHSHAIAHGDDSPKPDTVANSHTESNTDPRGPDDGPGPRQPNHLRRG